MYGLFLHLVENLSFCMDLENLQKDIELALGSFPISCFIENKKHAKTSKQKRDNVKENLQKPLRDYLQDKSYSFLSSFHWKLEENINSNKDSVDIYGKNDDAEIYIELDSWRADQVAKKMVSRFSNIIKSGSKQVVYVAVCYPGTKHMNLEECKKYFGYGQNILSMIKDKSFFIGAFINKSDKIEIFKQGDNQ